MNPSLQIEHLGFSFGDHRVFSSIDWTIGPGLHLVLGGDGRGKTTLLRLLAGEWQPQTGQIRLDGLVSTVADYRAQVFWVEPRSEAFHALNAMEFFAQRAAEHAGFDLPLAAGELTDTLGLREHAAKPLYMLSTGSRRKVFLAAAFASGAPLTLIDMPFGALDKPSIARIAQLLQAAAAQTQRVLVVADYEAPPGLRAGQTLNLGD